MIPTPHLPPPYIAGKLQVPAGVVSNLLELIQQQLQPNAPGTGVELLLSADAANVGSIMVGTASPLGGPVSQDNYAVKLTAASPTKVWRSAYPGSTVPLGDIQLLSPQGGELHLELQL